MDIEADERERLKARILVLLFEFAFLKHVFNQNCVFTKFFLLPILKICRQVELNLFNDDIRILRTELKNLFETNMF